MIAEIRCSFHFRYRNFVCVRFSIRQWHALIKGNYDQPVAHTHTHTRLHYPFDNPNSIWLYVARHEHNAYDEDTREVETTYLKTPTDPIPLIRPFPRRHFTDHTEPNSRAHFVRIRPHIYANSCPLSHTDNNNNNNELNTFRLLSNGRCVCVLSLCAILATA